MSHWYRFFPGDYLRDTLHLGWFEDCAYRRLIDLYHARGRPIPNDRAYIMRAIRASEPEQQNAVDVILSEFFTLERDGWHQKKCDEELSRTESRTASSEKANKVRWSKNKNIAAPDGVHAESGWTPNQNQNQKNQDLYIATNVAISPRTSSENVPYGRIVDLYHELLPELPRVVKLTEARKAQIRQRWKGKDAEDLDDWRNYFLLVKESRFLTGLAAPSNGRKVFRADLEWLVKEANFTKVLEGRYE